MQGIKRIFTGKPCKHGHISERGLDGICLECLRLKSRINYSKNIEAERQRGRQYYWNNLEKEQNRGKQYRLNHIEEIQIKGSTYRKNNPEKICASTRKYQAQKLHATPSWLTKEQFKEIEEFYRIAKLKELLTGQKFHVDHIYPLQGKTCTGLHVPWNLQILSSTNNKIKGNKIIY